MRKEIAWVDQTFLGQKDSGLHAEICYLETEDDQIVARTYVEAPRRGDEVLGLVMDEIQKMANKLRRPVTHIGDPSNKGAVRLFKRTPGYERKKSLRGPLFLRTFTPQRNRV